MTNTLDILLATLNTPLPLKAEGLRKLIEQTRLGQSLLSSRIPGAPLCLRLRGDIREYYFSSEEMLRNQSRMEDIYSLYASEKKPQKFCPESTEFNDALKILDEELLAMQNFIKNCIAGSLDMVYINTCASFAQQSGTIAFLPKGWTPLLHIIHEEDSGIAKPFQDDLEQQAILTPLFQGRAEDWNKIKICAECGRFFFPQRKSAQFCSTQCRMRFNQKK